MSIYYYNLGRNKILILCEKTPKLNNIEICLLIIDTLPILFYLESSSVKLKKKLNVQFISFCFYRVVYSMYTASEIKP